MKCIVALKDTAARVFGVPFVVQACPQAVRSLRDEVNSKDSTSDVKNHPDDFELYHVANFDDDTGFVSFDATFPVLLVRAKDLRDPV
jgi:hypothetical protein